jgi:hypothetical protein
MLKSVITVLFIAISLAACNTIALDNFINKNAVSACNAASRAYAVFVATDPSPAKLAKVNGYYQYIHDQCLDPNSITSQEIAIVLAQYYAMQRYAK